MIRIAFVGVEQTQRDDLLRIIDTFSKKNNIECQIDWFLDVESCVFCLQVKYDVFIIDIDTEDEIDKIEFAFVVREHNKDASVIFIASSDERAAEGYGMRAEAYLIKPLTNEVLTKTLEALFSHSSYLSGIVMLGDRDNQYRLDIRTVCRLKKNGNKNEVILVDRRTGHFACKISLRCAFDDLAESLLAYTQMKEISSSAIVNTDHIKHIDERVSEAYLADGTIVHVDPTKLQSLLEAHQKATLSM